MLTISEFIGTHDFCNYHSPQSYHKLHLPKFKNMNIGKVIDILNRRPNYSLYSVKGLFAIILFGSSLTKWFPNDIDLLLIHSNDEDNENIIIDVDSPQYIYRGYETSLSSGSCTYNSGSNNPIKIDMIMIKEKDVFNEISKNKNGDTFNCACLNALKYGVILCCKESYDIDKFGIENESKFKLVVKNKSMRIKRK